MKILYTAEAKSVEVDRATAGHQTEGSMWTCPSLKR